MSTLNEILSECYRRLRYPSSPPAAITTRLTALINESHGEIISLPQLSRLRDNVIPIVIPANVARSALPPAVSRILAITDRTNNNKLVQVPLSELRLSDPAQAFTGGYPMRYAVIGDQAVYRQPSAATGIWAASSAAGDTSQKVFVETINTSGVSGFALPFNIISAGTTLTGTTRVQIGTDTNHIQVNKFYLDSACAGYALLFDAATTGNELARIPIGATYSRYEAIEWWPVPTQATTLYVDVTRRVYDLVKGTDEPLLPRDYDDILIQGVLLREYLILNDSRYTQAKNDYEGMILKLTEWVMSDGDRLASLRPIPQGFNRLGSNYPNQAGEWWPF